MQAELPDVAIIGVNEVGYESGNDSFCEDRDLPWLQDTDEIGMWDSWKPVYRDIFILDAEGTLVDIYNLTTNDLSEDYDTLKTLLEGYAAE